MYGILIIIELNYIYDHILLDLIKNIKLFMKKFLYIDFIKNNSIL